MLEPIYVGSTPDGHTVPDFALVNDDELGEILLDAAIPEGAAAYAPRVVRENAHGCYEADHVEQRWIWVDLRSVHVAQWSPGRLLRYTQLAIFLMRVTALERGVPQHVGPPGDETGLGVLRGFAHDPALVDRVRAFRRDRANMFRRDKVDDGERL